MLKNYVKFILAIVFASNVMAQNVPSYVPKDGLVGWWPFNGNANDESGNGNHGTVNGATLTSDRNGKANSAYNFDGDKDYIDIGNSNTLKRFKTNFTITAWIKPKKFSDSWEQSIISNRTTDNCGSKFGIGGQRNQIQGNLSYVINGGDKSILTNSNEQLSIDTFQFVSISSTYKNNITIIKLYINNQNVIIDTLIDSLGRMCDPLNQKTYIGFESYLDIPNEMSFNGKIDDIAIYNRALSDQEVKQLYEGCTKETATSSSFNALMYTTNAPINLSANPTGGTFSGNGIANNAFNPSKAKLGKNQVKYNFKNATGCADSTDFAMVVVDTVGTTCTKMDTVKVTKYDTITVTNTVTKYDTITIKNNVYDTVTIINNITKYDTVKVTETIYDTIKVKESTYDTLKIKVQLTTGIKAGQIATMNVYPNPTSDVVIIETSDVVALNGYSYKMVDLQGKQVYKELVTKSKTEISLKSIGAKGVYILHVLDAQGVSIENKKIVLE